jgi:hypothetical protein
MNFAAGEIQSRGTVFKREAVAWISL